METLNERIKNLRKDKNYTQVQLAEILNVTDKAVSKWEVGEANPDIGLLPKIAEIFGVTLDYLLTGKREEDKISLEDMDSNKRMYYLIKKDDYENFNKYSYDVFSQQYNSRNNNIYFRSTIKFGRTELPVLNIEVWKNILDNNANKIFNGCCDSLLNLVKDNISIAVLLAEILDDFIKKCIELDRDDVLKALGVRYFEIGVNKNKPLGQRTTFYLPIVYGRKYEKESTFFINSETLEYFFKNAEKSPKSFNYITEVEIKTKIPSLPNGRPAGEEKYYTCTNLYNEIIMLAIKYDKYDVINNYLDAFKNEVQYFNKIKNEPRTNYLNYGGDFLDDGYSIKARLLGISREIIIKLIQLGKIELAKEMVNYNRSISESVRNLNNSNIKNTDFLYIISDSEIERISKLNRNDLNDDEKLRLESVINYLIIPSVLKTARNLKLVREILDNNYYNYYEFAYESIKKKNVKELFKFFIDNNLNNLASNLMKGENSYSRILSDVWNIFSSAPGYSEYEENKILIDSQNKTGLERTPLSRANNYYGNVQKKEIPYIEIFKKQYGKVEQYIGMLEDNPIIKRIKELKEEIYNEVEKTVLAEKKTKEDEKVREKIAKGLTKDYFLDLLNKGENELFIIKLCALQDAIFMYDYHYEGEDYSERLEAHFKDLNDKVPKTSYCDDGWGYNVVDEEWEYNKVIPAQERISNLRNLFYKLRIARNNISHPKKEKVEEISRYDLLDCLNYVISISKKGE